MISRIDHVSIAVKEQEKAVHFFRDILGAIPGAKAEDPATKFDEYVKSHPALFAP